MENQKNKALFVTSSTTQPQSDDSLYCNAEESDTRIWLHVMNSAGNKKLVLSPDTDVYHVGLPIVAGTELECTVRLNVFNSTEQRFLDLQALITAFQNDPSLAAIEQVTLPSVMQMLYISTGCDFISFFTGIGKATFMATLFEYAEFICSNTQHTPGNQTLILLHTAFYPSLGWLGVPILESIKQHLYHHFPHQCQYSTHFSRVNRIPHHTTVLS